jgi:hypothetical protein
MWADLKPVLLGVLGALVLAVVLAVFVPATAEPTSPATTRIPTELYGPAERYRCTEDTARDHPACEGER